MSELVLAEEEENKNDILPKKITDCFGSVTFFKLLVFSSFFFFKMNDLYPKAMLRLLSSKGNLFQCCTHWYGVPKSKKLTNHKLNNMARKMLLPISLWFIFQLKLWTLQVDVGLGKWAHYKKPSRKQTQSKWEENTPSTPFSSKVLHIRKYKNFYKSRQLLFWSIRVCVNKIPTSINISLWRVKRSSPNNLTPIFVHRERLLPAR